MQEEDLEIPKLSKKQKIKLALIMVFIFIVCLMIMAAGIGYGMGMRYMYYHHENYSDGSCPPCSCEKIYIPISNISLGAGFPDVGYYPEEEYEEGCNTYLERIGYHKPVYNIYKKSCNKQLKKPVHL